MKLPLSLLKEFIDIQLEPSSIAEYLTLLGMEVEGIQNEKPAFSHVVAGEIISAKPHPSADKLLVLEVSDGKKTYPVVCGDLTCKPKMRAPFAKVGAKFFTADGVISIEKREMRGTFSEGMLCTGKELGISEEADNVYMLDHEIPLGTDLTTVLWDPVLEIALTPNLGHCMSALGIARELSAYLKKPWHMPSYPLKEEAKAPGFSLAIHAPQECKRYAFRTIDNVQVGPSPFWLKRKMEALGLRPINNIVDSTNLILFLYGQPLHAFDLDKIEGGIEVKLSTQEMPFEFLDEKTRTIPKGSLLICDKKKPLVLAGIMGGLSSSVSDHTKRLLVESAYFDAPVIQKASKALSLRTDSSMRFEKGVDPNGVVTALDAACALIQHVAGGSVSKAIDQKEDAFSPKHISCRLARACTILGHKFSLSEMEGIFGRLDFSTKSQNDTVTATVPAYRHDLNQEIDLIEEVARIYGYNNLEKKAPYFTATSIPHDPMYLFENKVRKRLMAENMTEFLNADLISPFLAQITQESTLPKSSQIEVLHSKSEEHKILRTSLMPGLLQSIAFNLSRKNQNIRAFEIGRSHFKKASEFIEQNLLAIILTGSESPHHWSKNATEADFFEAKGIIENFLESQGCKEVTFAPSFHPSLHPYRQANVFIKGQDMGVIGEIHPDVLHKFDIKQRVQYGELNLSGLLPLLPHSITMTPLQVFPGSERDWTLTLKDNLAIEEVFKAIYSIHSPLLEKVELTSLYKSEKIGADKKNATLRFYYRDKEKTVSFEKVEKEHSHIASNVRKALKGSLFE